MTDQLDRVRGLVANGHGDRHIAGVLDVTRHVARGLMIKAQLTAPAPAVAEIEPRTASEFAERITACWHRSREAYIEAGRLLCSAKAALEHGEFEAMVATLPFKIRKAEMLMEIYRDQRLVNPQYVALLPNELGTLYDITRLKEDKFQSAITSGTIRPDIERKEVECLLRGGPINGARSVMGSRVEPDDSLDFFCTPPWATRALCEHVFPRIGPPPGWLKHNSVWEPACGEGHMAEVLSDYFETVYATDVFDYGHPKATILNFLGGSDIIDPLPDWIITNPPFGDKTIPFILRAIELARVGVAMFLRLQILETIERYEQIFKPHPPALVAFFAERVNLCRGRWDPDGGTATAYCWLVWMKDRAPMAPFWIPPGCRESLSKEDDRARFAAWSMPDNAEAAE